MHASVTPTAGISAAANSRRRCAAIFSCAGPNGSKSDCPPATVPRIAHATTPHTTHECVGPVMPDGVQHSSDVRGTKGIQSGFAISVLTVQTYTLESG